MDVLERKEYNKKYYQKYKDVLKLKRKKEVKQEVEKAKKEVKKVKKEVEIPYPESLHINRGGVIIKENKRYIFYKDNIWSKGQNKYLLKLKCNKDDYCHSYIYNDDMKLRKYNMKDNVFVVMRNNKS